VQHEADVITPKSREALTASGKPVGRLHLFCWVVFASFGTAVTARAITTMLSPVQTAIHILPWFLLIAVASLIPIHGWKATRLIADAPASIAAALVLSPLEAALLGFLASFDAKEFRGTISLPKTLFNRSQIGILLAGASAAVHQLSDRPANSQWIIPLALLAFGVYTALNYLLVGTAIYLEYEVRISRILRKLYLGVQDDFLVTSVSWAVLGAMLALLYEQIHPYAIIAFLAPTLLSQRALLRSQALVDTHKAYRSKDRALKVLSEQIFQERRDERRMIAADLHDEVLQPLFRVTLMAQVLKADLATGRLLELEQDIPELLTAAEIASNTLRELIGDLRRSPLGRGGLQAAVPRLVAWLSEQSSFKTHTDVGEIELAPGTQLSVYQILKEALINAVQHAAAKNVWISIRQEEVFSLMVRDDGVGFDSRIPRDGHFGLDIMRERAASIGAELYVDSNPGDGTTVTLVWHPDHRPNP
jgi:signal transduction histidine kinase